MRKRFKIPLFFFLSVFVILCGVYLLLTQTGILEGQVNYWANYFLKKSYPVEVKVGDITGSFFNQLIIEDFSISYTETEPPYTLLKSDEVTLRYKLLNWWRGKKIFSYVGLKEPEMEIRKIKDRYLLPIPQRKDTTTEDSEPLSFQVDTLNIENGSFVLSSEKDQEQIEKLDLQLSLTIDENGLKLNFYGAGLYYPRKKLHVEGVEGGINFSSDELVFKDFRFSTDRSQLEISGRVADFEQPTLSLTVQSSPLSLDELKRLFGIGLSGTFDIKGSLKGNLKNFAGRARLTGNLFDRDFENVDLRYQYLRKKLILSQVSGKIFNSPMLGSAELDLRASPESYSIDATAENLDLANIVSTGFHTDFSGSLSVEGKGFSPDDFFMELEIDLKDGRIQNYTFSRAKGDFSLDFSHIHFHPGFVIVYKNTLGFLQGDIHYDQRVKIKAKVHFSDVDDFKGQIFLKEFAGAGSADLQFDGPLSDLNVRGKLESDSLWIYKWYTSDLSGEFEILDFSTSRRGFFDLGFGKGTLWGVEYDSAGLKLGLEDQIVAIDTAWAKSKDIDLDLSAVLDNSTYPRTLRFRNMDFSFQEALFQSEGEVELHLGQDSVFIKQASFKLGEGKIKLTGLIGTDENLEINSDLSKIDISPWIDKLAPQRKMGGTLDLKLALKGSYDKPEIELKGQVEEYRYKEVNLGNLGFDLSYKSEKLAFSRLELAHPDERYTLTGFLPVNLSLRSFTTKLLNQPQNLTVKGEGKKISLFPLFLPWLEYVEGPFEAEVDISGTPFSPQFDGNLALDSGTLKIKSFEDPATDLKAELTLAGQNLTITRLEGELSHKPLTRGNIFKRIWRLIFPRKEEKGDVSAAGEIVFRKLNQVDYDLQVEGTNVPFRYEFADLSGIADLDLQFKGTDPSSISGDMFFHQLLFQEPFKALISSGSSREGREKPSDLNLRLSADHNCWIINQDMNVEFKGEVRALRSGSGLRLLGNLETIRGKYFLFGNTFKIESGSFVFDNVERIDPKLDLSVSADMATGYSPTERNQFVKTYAEKVGLSIQGTLSAPEVNPSSDSPYSKGEILELLAFRQRFFTADTLERGSVFQDGVLKSLGGGYGTRLLENIATRSLGVETFEIEPAWAGKFSLWDTRITIGKYISDKIYFRYTRRLSQTSGEEAGVEYRLNRYLFFQGFRDKEGKVYLGLNLHWEY